MNTAVDASAVTPATPPTPVDLAPDLTFYPAAAGASGPLVLVLPGGGYMMHADHEGEPIARWLNGIGINALVVRYPIAPARYPSAIDRVREVMDATRSGELDLAVDRTRVGVLGFSAGGHLAALVSSGLTTGGPDARPDTRPDLAILAYPVISFIENPHLGSIENLLGPRTTPEQRTSLSAELLVDASTPPTFVWHTAEDAAVPVSNSLAYASALAARGIPFDLHVFERGEHGIGLGDPDTPASAWPSLCAAWLSEHGWTGTAGR
ncbi:alpha/beta hydrolase [Glaciihabitans sp. dw_435]|uniref:alpha/beta hydrolase n=1 Tax=Glaciihabitans sp. dw_435 TaxID=2720081 RepID=UPI0027DCE098|nr:alpha/beta hydrolase [Glaciihabitans sp. dw_435]